MTLSIVIPSHRRADLLRFCLASVVRFAPPGTQIIVVDDASRDGVVARTASEFTNEIVRLPRSAGFCTAANAGIAKATGEIVELLNDDAEATPGWADAAIRRFSDGRVVAVAPLVLLHGTDSRIDSAGDDYDYGGFASKRGHGRRYASDGCFAVPCRVGAASAAAAFYRRSALIEVGGFPEGFHAYFDDVDLSCRLLRRGEIWYEPGSVVWHRLSASHGRRPGRRLLEQQSRNEELLFWRNRRSERIGQDLPRHAVVLAGKMLRRLEEGRAVPWWIGRIRAWYDLVMNRKAFAARKACSTLALANE